MEQNPPGRRCQHCGTALSEETTAGLCPRCLLEMNFASRTMPGGEPSPQIPPPTPEEMAARFPQFEILECLGRGGMGIVYKARQKMLDRLVAIKVLAGERHDDPQFEARFEKEAHTLARLNHPNIVTVHDFGESDGMFYLVMEFVDGVNLRDVLRDGRMEPAQALAIVPEICAALQFAHDHGVVHRDIKPENILIDRDGRVKLADFGIAALVGSDADHSGTPPYMAPEQQAAGGTIDHRADIYALGVVLYEMLTGERPEQDPSKPTHRVEIDVRLDEIVLRALEKEPARRYQTAGEFRTVVETIRAKAPKESRTEAAGSKVEINSPTPTAARESTNSPMLPPRRGIVMVGRRGGKVIINWPGVAMVFLMILAIVLAGGALFCWILGTSLDDRAVAIGTLSAVMAVSIGLARARSTPLERLVDLDDASTSAANDAAGSARGLTSGATPSPFRRLWWLFLIMPPVCLLLGLIAGVLWGFLTPMQYEAKTVIEISTQATGSDHADVMALSSGDSEWITRLNATAVLDRVVGQLDLSRSWSVDEAQARQTLVTLATFPAIPGTDLRELRIRHTDAAQAAMIANAWTQALKAWSAEQDTGEAIVVVEEATTPERSFGEFSKRVIFGSAFAGLLLSPLIAILLIQTIHRGGRWLLRVVALTASGTAVLALLVFAVVSLLRKLEVNEASSDAARPPVSIVALENSPEHTVRSFMKAIRDGDVDAALAWVSPEMKQGKEFPLHLELASRILRDETYAGQLDRLTRFAGTKFTNVDGTTMLFAARVTPPTGDQAQDNKHGPVLILSSTPDGWRVAHFGEGSAGKPLSEHVKEFQIRETGKNTPDAMTPAKTAKGNSQEGNHGTAPPYVTENVPRIPSPVAPQETNTRFGFIRQSGIFGLLIAYLTVILFVAGAVLVGVRRSRKVLKVFFLLAFLPAVAGLYGTYLGNRKIDAHARGGLDAASAEGHALVAHGRSVANVTSYRGAGATAALLMAVASGLLITRTSPDKRLINIRNP
jgi:tRNA A-37 threonylcarbamoyl transferase component Bud32/capsular polysaccharide biosynthesis protein